MRSIIRHAVNFPAALPVLLVSLLGGCSVVRAELPPYLLGAKQESGPVLEIQPSRAPAPPATGVGQ